MNAELSTILEQAVPMVGILCLSLVAGIAFLTTPLGNFLNIITIPLGYAFSSCPYCPEFAITKLETHECVECGKEHKRGFGNAAAYRDGEEYPFCSNECLNNWKESSDLD